MMPSEKPGRLPLIAGLVVVVAAAFAIGVAADIVYGRNATDSWLDEQAGLVEEVVREALTGVVADLDAAAAYVAQASPNHAEFESFVDRIDGDENALGVGYITEIDAASFDAYLEGQRQNLGPDWDIFGIAADGTVVPIERTGRTSFYPVRSFSLGRMVRNLFADDPEVDEIGPGLDAGFDPRWRADIERGLQQSGPAFSQSISLHLDRLRLDRVFFAMVPVESDNEAGRGLVIAMMVEEMLLTDMEGGVLDNVEWQTIAPGESSAVVEEAGAKLYPLELPGTVWTLAVTPNEDAIADLDAIPWWVSGLSAAMLALLVALLLWLTYDRRAERKRVSQLHQVSEDKDRFLAAVSHELRTPLTVVAGVAHSLYEAPESFDDSERSEFMRMLIDQTDELSGIVEDLLVAARSDIGNVAIHYGEVDLGAEVATAIKTTDVDARTRGAPGVAYGDPQRVRQILRNLLTNAKRYGGPDVRIDFTEGTGWVEVIVADNGEGIPRDKRGVVFDPYRSAHLPSNAVRSVGLGLYISQNLAQAMNGDLEYVYDGEWSHFRLRLQSPPMSSDNRPSTSEAGNVSAQTP